MKEPSEVEVYCNTAGAGQKPTVALGQKPIVVTTPPTVWLKKLIEVIAHAYFLGEGVMYLLQIAIDQAYKDSGVYTDTARAWPTFQHVMEALDKIEVKGRSAQWMDSTRRTLGVLCFGEFSRVVNVGDQTPLQELLEQRVILELDSLTNSDKTFFIEALLLWIHHYRMQERSRESFKHAIVIEEAHHILLRKKQEMTGTEAITDIILREIRELGESIILVDQHPSLISLPALGNTYTTICMNLKHRSDMLTIADSLLLDRADLDFLGRLAVGHAIVKLQGRWFLPFLVKIPLLRLKKGEMTDLLLSERVEGCSGSSGHEETIEGDSGTEKAARVQEKKEEPKDRITNAEEKLLTDIARNPLSGVVQRYRRIGLSTYQGNEAKNSLFRKGLIYYKSVPTRTSRIKILLLSNKAVERLKLNGYDRYFRKNASFEHEFWKQRIAELYRKRGYQVQVEKEIADGKEVDIAAEKDGERIAIEVETGKSDAISNAKKCLDAGFTEVISVALSRHAMIQIKQKLKEAGLNREARYEVVLVDDVIKEADSAA